ncbi:hypothetical protein ACWDZW_39250, partial [Streptomyces coeruleorubidus]
MTDQVVETGDVRLTGHASGESRFLGRTRELKVQGGPCRAEGVVRVVVDDGDVVGGDPVRALRV